MYSSSDNLGRLSVSPWRGSGSSCFSLCVSGLVAQAPGEHDFLFDLLTDAKIKISMDDKGRWIGNHMIERLWQTIKYEDVYLPEYARVPEARAGTGRI